MTVYKKLILILMCLAAICPPLSAADKPAAKGAKKYPKGVLATGMEACKDDIKKFCPDVALGQKRIGQCLYAHLSELSPSCLEFARHGGAGHEEASLMDIDRNYNVSLSSRPAKR